MPNLEKELHTYQAKLPELSADEGKFVVIAGDSIVGIYAAYEDALKAGYEHSGMNPFLVKQISTTEQIAYFSRDMGAPCPA